MTTATADVRVTNHGSLIGLAFLTDEARNWATEHLPDDAPTFGGATFVEPRYAAPIIEGMQEAGLNIE